MKKHTYICILIQLHIIIYTYILYFKSYMEYNIYIYTHTHIYIYTYNSAFILTGHMYGFLLLYLFFSCLLQQYDIRGAFSFKKLQKIQATSWCDQKWKPCLEAIWRRNNAWKPLRLATRSSNGPIPCGSRVSQLKLGIGKDGAEWC